MLIEANDEFMALNKILCDLTMGRSLREDKFHGLYGLTEIIYENSAMYAGQNDDDSFAKFMEVMMKQEITVEEKYERFMRLKVQ